MRVTTEADRQTARYALLTPAQVADQLECVSADTVRSWCKHGWLQHVDFRRPKARTPSFGIDWAWVEAFIAKGGATAFVSGDAKPNWWKRHAA
jgi:hypothetical protein